MQTKQLIIIISIAANILLAAGLGYCTIQKKQKFQKISPLQKAARIYNVALFEPAIHPAIEEISNGFKETLQKNGSAQYRFTTYNASGNKTLLRAQAEEIATGNFDLVFTIGTACSKTATEVTTKKQSQTPIVFSAIADPVGNHIAQSLQSSGNHTTGVIELDDYEQQMSILLALKPETKQVVLVYDPTHNAQRDKDRKLIKQILTGKQVGFKAVEVYQPNEIQQKVSGFLEQTDVVLVLKDNTIVSGIDGLIKLCNQYSVTLYASDLNSGQKGAALAYGFKEAQSGIAAAQKALKILEQGKKPTDIPITPVEHFNIQLNSTVAQLQGLQIHPDIQFFLKAGKVI